MNSNSGRLDFWSNRETARVLDSIAKLLELPSRSSLGNVLLTTNTIDIADIRSKRKRRLALVAENEQEQQENKELNIHEIASKSKNWKEQFKDIVKREKSGAPYLIESLSKLNELDKRLKIFSETPRKKTTIRAKAISSKAFSGYALLVAEYESAINKPNDRTKIKFIGDYTAFELFKISSNSSTPVKQKLGFLLRELTIEKHTFEDNQELLRQINELQQACNFGVKQYHIAKKSNTGVDSSLRDLCNRINAIHSYIIIKITN